MRRRAVLATLLGLLWPLAAESTNDANKAGASSALLPGVSGSSFNLDSIKALEGSGLLTPPKDLAQYWFSAEADFNGTATGSAAKTLTQAAAGWTVGQWIGYSVKMTSGNATGLIRKIVYNDATNLILSQDWEIVGSANTRPVNTDTYVIFSGDLPPGTATGTCRRDDPCLDLARVQEVLSQGPAWVWMDSGDVWDSANEWCTVIATRCNAPKWETRLRPQAAGGTTYETFIRSDPDRIFWAISGTDMTGTTQPVIDCDTPQEWPHEGTGAAGVFEAEQSITAASGWYLVQGVTTRCWTTPVVPAMPNQGSGGNGAGVGIYRVDQAGRLLAYKNRHGDLFDSGIVGLVAGARVTGDLPGASLTMIDVQFGLGNFERFGNGAVGKCTGADNPFDCCTAANVCVNEGNGVSGDPPIGVLVTGGDVTFIGGDFIYQQKETTTDANNPPATSHNSTMIGFDKAQADTSQVNIINAQFKGSGATGQAQLGFAYFPTTVGGQILDLNIVNSSFSSYKGNATDEAIFIDGGASGSSTNARIAMKLINLSFNDNRRNFHRTDTTGVAADLGYTLLGRCLAIDTIGSTGFLWEESTVGRCLLDSIDIQSSGFDAQDVAANDWHACGTNAADPAALQAANPGPFATFNFFNDSASFDVNGGATGTLYVVGDYDFTNPVKLAADGSAADESVGGQATCTYSTTIPMNVPIPKGVFSPDTAMRSYRVEGRRNFGWN